MANIRAPFKAYGKHVGSRPLLDSAVRGTAGAGLGYAGGALASRLMLGLPILEKSDEELAQMSDEELKTYLRKRQLYKRNEESGRAAKVKAIGALLGAGAGALPVLAQSYDSKLSAMDNLNKGVNRTEFYKNNPDVLDRNKHEALDAAKGSTTFNPDPNAFDSGRTKVASFDTYRSNHVPVHGAMHIIERDPFLTMGQKRAVNGIIGGTHEGDSGNVSGQTIANAAVKAGIGGMAGFAFGKTMGNLFALEHEQINKLSRVGGVAGAIYNTGILNEKIGDIF